MFSTLNDDVGKTKKIYRPFTLFFIIILSKLIAKYKSEY